MRSFLLPHVLPSVRALWRLAPRSIPVMVSAWPPYGAANSYRPWPMWHEQLVPAPACPLLALQVGKKALSLGD